MEWLTLFELGSAGVMSGERYDSRLHMPACASPTPAVASDRRCNHAHRDSVCAAGRTGTSDQ
jgi:hypothetical protein